MKIVGKITIGAIRYRLARASSKEVPELLSADGYCDWENAMIYIRDNVHSERLADATVHEIFHACFESSGAYHEILELCGGDHAKADQLEERLIRMLTPMWIQALRQMKGLIK